MKCIYCKKPIHGSRDAFVTIPNPEQCGYQARRPTSFIHARCFETEIRRNALEKAEAVLDWLRYFFPDEPLFSKDLNKANEAVIALDIAIASTEGR